ncbi:MAG: tetratricopeptide repeat protein, partial [Alphaproteobacteria bacterium]|nr:tetratricopeptide repeat protein [Alphaproteobacteria bacterium]
MLTKTFKLILTLAERRPAANLPRRLDALFGDLAAQAPPQPHHEIEDAIWALWTSHEDPTAAAAMERAITMISRKRHAAAEALFTRMVQDHPDWPEAWNKRATLYYLMGRDDDSIADIHRTLELEPRHFGAICGFAQICLRNGDAQKAIATFEAALAINPR